MKMKIATLEPSTHVVIVNDKYDDFVQYFDREDEARGYAERIAKLRDARLVVLAKIITSIDPTRARVLDSVDQ